MLGADATIRLLSPRPGNYAPTLGLDPFPPPAADATDRPSVWVLVNGRPASRLYLTWDPSRIGLYQVALTTDATRAGVNHLKLVLDQADGPRVRSWHVRVQPGG